MNIEVISFVIGLLLPFWIALSICVGVAIGKRFETFVVGSYVQDTVRKNNELIEENQKLRRMIKDER